MTRSTPFIIGMALLALSACANGQPPEPVVETGSVIDTNNTDETKNVLYRGTIEEAGVSVYMQGTHRIKLENGTYVLVESDDVNLNRYVGSEVEVFGSVRPTVEAGGLIMRVQSITSLEADATSSVSSTTFCGGIEGLQCPADMDCIDDPSDSCDPTSGGADCGGICVQRSSSSASAATTSSVASTTTSTAAQSSQQASSIASSIAASSVAATTNAASSLPAWEGSADLTAKAKLMAQANMDMSNWTQQYCSTQIGFCIPVHKNWWYKSFGTTSSYLWHLEIGTAEMNNLGEGPISVNLVSGDTASAGLTDGSVTVQGDTVVGVRSWTGNRRFEIRAPANLEAAVRILVTELKTN